MEIITSIINSVNNFLWGKNILVVMLIGTAIYMSFRTKFMQFRLFGDIIRILGKKDSNQDGISSLEAFFLGTACRVGAGNITGVVAAVSIGGAGSIFWMWIVALLGAATSFVESTLAVMYREKIGKNEYRGGTPWIIHKRYNLKCIGILYAIASIICYMGVVQVMSNSITDSINVVYNIPAKTISIVLTIFIALILFLRTKKDGIIVALNKIVPFMAVLYLLVVLYVLVTRFTAIPSTFVHIFTEAFTGNAVMGASVGTVIMIGVRRGLFSNEAGSGNSNYAAAVVDVNEPAKQGMVQALGVFVDTLVVCSATAFVILLSEADVINGQTGMAMFQKAIESHIGWIGLPFSVVVLFFFSVSTILGVAYYGKNAINFIHSSSYLKHIYSIIIILMVYIGGIEQNLFVWSLADFGLGIMTVINIIFIIPLAGEAVKVLFEYEKTLK